MNTCSVGGAAGGVLIVQDAQSKLVERRETVKIGHVTAVTDM